MTSTTGFPSFNLQTTTPASTSSPTLSLGVSTTTASTSATTTSTSQATSSAVQASSTGPATTTAITPAASQAPKLPSEIVGKSVEEVLHLSVILFKLHLVDFHCDSFFSVSNVLETRAISLLPEHLIFLIEKLDYFHFLR